MAMSLLDRDITPPPSLKEDGDRWRPKASMISGSAERWRASADESNNDSWSKRDSNSSTRQFSNRDRSPRDRKRDRDVRRSSNGIRNDRMVYISNIPYNVRWMELKDIVREKAGEVNFVELLEDRNGKSKGAAVVEFREKESVPRCVDALHRFPMNDRLLTAKEIRDPIAFFRKVKDDTGVDFLNGLHGGTALSGLDTRSRNEEQFETYGLSPAFLNQLNISGPLTNRVFISNLPYNVQSGRLNDIFSLAGKVTWVDLQLDKDGRSKGMAVVQFTHPIEAVQAISMLNNQRIFDRQINVKMDKFDPIDERKEGELPIGLRGVGMGLGANGAPLGDVSSIISTLSSTTTPNAFDSNAVSFNNNQNSYQSGPIPSLSSVLPFTPVYGPSVTSAITPSNTPYTSSSYSNFSAGGYPSRSIIIKNLPVDYTWQIVRDRVQQFGPVDVTEMIAPGCAKVTFTGASDAERARKALQNTTVEGRLIGVEFLV